MFFSCNYKLFLESFQSHLAFCSCHLSLVFKGPVLGPTKNWDWTETGLEKTKTEKDQSSVFFSLSLSLGGLGMLFRLTKDWSQLVFSVDR